MQKAVELATEILKKSQIVQDTSSNRLKKRFAEKREPYS